MKILVVPFALATAFGATAALAEPVAYDFDPSHSQVVFDYQHMGFSTSTGIINGVTGKLMLDAENPANSSVEATIPLSGLRTVSPELDKHLFGPDFFNTDQASAVATFKSTKVELTGTRTAKVTGDLTFLGVTKPVTLDAKLTGAGVNPMSKAATVGFSATTTIKRSDFGLGYAAPAVGDEVKLKITAAFEK